MTDPITPGAALASPASLDLSAARAGAPSAPRGASFRDHLEGAVRAIGDSERAMDGAFQRVTRRGAMGMDELIAFQAVVYRHSLTVDVASRVVEKATSAVRQTLQSQSA